VAKSKCKVFVEEISQKFAHPEKSNKNMTSRQNRKEFTNPNKVFTRRRKIKYS
jgi:hypothetical protein